ncbi:putative cholecystokinin receptor type A-like [Apostichopus japonicus]|uniref:Putative cholecystokinin receptor type A-like n=1 Tax=Stichopus japonicus TaxID=307972 RepID=A0A2G8KQL2_STIJA|nr:putative cholecystokinin receptor type A-like [Apostichopus japonicus]
MSGLEDPIPSFSLGNNSVTDYSIYVDDYIQTEDCNGLEWNLENFTHTDIKTYLIYSTFSMFILSTVLPVIAVIGILGNGAFIFLIWKVPSMRNNMNIILLNLAVADVIYLFVGTSEKFVNTLSSPVAGDKYFFGNVAQCWIIYPSLLVSSFTSLLLVSLLSVERYLAICRPLVHIKISGRRRTLCYVTLVWLSSFIVTASIYPSYTDFFTACIVWPNDTTYESYPSISGFCLSEDITWLSIGEIVQIFPFLVALILNVVCFVKIIFKLYRRLPSSVPTMDDAMATRQRKSANAATRMLLVNGIAFFIFATPFHLVNAIQFFEIIFPSWSPDIDVLKYIFLLMLYINSAINPYYLWYD